MLLPFTNNFEALFFSSGQNHIKMEEFQNWQPLDVNPTYSNKYEL